MMRIRHIRSRGTMLCAAGLLLTTTPSPALELDEIRAGNLNAAQEWFTAKQAAAATNANWVVLPRILIDTAKPAIFFKAEATGIAPREIVEFYLIGERSGNAYETIAVALAEPGDIARAIQKMGLAPGKHADPAALRFWPQGERVHLFFDDIHAADLMLDERTGQTAPRSGFVFTASHQTQVDGAQKLSAQIEPPFSVAATYNEPQSVLDVPVQAPQSAVYSKQVQNPDIRFSPGQLLTVRIEPEQRTDGTKRIQKMQLTVSKSPPPFTIPAADLRFTLADMQTPDAPLPEKVPLETFFAHIREMRSRQQDPFIEIHLAADLSLLHVNRMARLIEAMENEDTLRVLPPPAGSLYYRAFIPNEEQRHREKRVAHPWELHLSHSSPPKLIQIDEEWQQGEVRPQIQIQEHTVSEPEHLSEKMSALRPNVNAVYVYAPQDMTVNNIMATIRPFLESHPLIHVFMNPPPTDRTSDAIPAATSE